MAPAQRRLQTKRKVIVGGTRSIDEQMKFLLLDVLISIVFRSSSMNNSTETKPHAILAFVHSFEIVALPVLIIFGSICNIMTFIVMRRRRMRVSSTCFYMAVLAVTDTLVLWTGCLNQWFYMMQIPTIVARSNLTCKLLPFLFVFFADAR